MIRQSFAKKALCWVAVMLLIVSGITFKAERAGAVTYGSTVLGGTGVAGYSGDGGPATAARLNGPSGIWRDMNSGVIYIADTLNNRIRKIDANGIITTVAGTGSAGYAGDGGAATSAKLNEPTDVMLDGSGNMYIADKSNHRVRKVSPNGIITTVAGTGQGGYNGDGISALSARLNEPYGLALDLNGNLLIADSVNARIRQVNAEGIISTIVGTGTVGSSGDNGAATSARINQPYHLAVDTNGTLYIVDAGNQNARKVDTNGVITTLKGKNPRLPANYPASDLSIYFPQGIAVDGRGNVYVPDSLNREIRKLDSNGYVYDISAGDSYVHGLKVDSNGTIYFVDNNQHKLTRMTLLSENAGLTSVAGASASAPGGGDGSTAGNAVTWAVSLPHSKTAIGRGDVVAAAAATAKLYTNSSFSTEVTGSGSIPLAETGTTTIYVKVTAEDAFTTKYYAVSVTRAPALSQDAGLTSVAGLTDNAPGGGNGAAAGTAVTLKINVPDSQSAVGLSEIIPSANATFKLYTDNGFTNEVTGNDSIPLTSNGTTYVYVAVTAQDTTIVKYYAVAIFRAAPLSHDAGLFSLAGQTDNAPAGGSGGTPGDAVAWSVNVPNGTTAISRDSIVAAADASFRLYTDSAWVHEVTGSSAISLTEDGATTIYVAVTAADATTVKHYAVTVNRAAPASADAGLASLAGQTDDAVGGGNGSAAGEAITWKLTVPDSKSELSRTDVVPAAGATFKLYKDNEFTEEVTASGTIQLAAGHRTTVYVAVTAEDAATVKYYAVSVLREAGATPTPTPTSTSTPTPEPTSTATPTPTPTSTSTPTPEPTFTATPTPMPTPSTAVESESVEVYINGKAEKTGNLTTTKINNRTVSTLTLDQQKLSGKLAAEGPNALVTLVINKQSDVVVAQLTSDNIGILTQYGATLEMKTATASYKLPSKELDSAKLAAQLKIDSDLQNMGLQIEITSGGADNAKLVEDAAQAGGFKLIVPPLDFAVKVIHQGKSYEIPRYTAYVERTIALPDGIDPSKVTTGLAIEPDGTTRHVPTKVEFMDGKYYAKINSLTNSVYSVVWNPVTFADVERHWAKDAVNDMGSRLIIQGVSEKAFKPDANITRAEYAAVIVRALGLKLGEGANPFGDVAADAWYASAIRTAVSYRLIDGFGDGTFRPNDEITWEQAMTMIARAMSVSGLNNKLQGRKASAAFSPFADANTVAAWARDGAADTLLAGIVTGRTGSRLEPQAHATRAETAVMVRRLLVQSDLIQN
ncbi:NHL domain-containing protein [Cohnella sp. 56]|uniref:NHL domain-containing protein n=1 Tax=Cohnella sp. 56 TaxID=3113722 RepID=UPI0030EAD29E